MTVMEILLSKGASLDIKNNKGLTPVGLALDRNKANVVKFINAHSDADKELLPRFLHPLAKNKEMRRLFTRIYPLFIMLYIGCLLESTAGWLTKFLILAALYPISYAWQKVFFDRHLFKYIPVAAAVAVIFLLYVTWFVYFRPIVFHLSLMWITFTVLTIATWYNFYKSYHTNPGYLTANRDQIKNTILQFVEQNEFALETLCTSCIIRRPLRSKHCTECDRCVAKFDHHCPWVDNCVGQDNLKYFVGFVTFAALALLYFLNGSIQCNYIYLNLKIFFFHFENFIFIF